MLSYKLMASIVDVVVVVVVCFFVVQVRSFYSRRRLLCCCWCSVSCIEQESHSGMINFRCST
jgi:hypothetical protein